MIVQVFFGNLSEQWQKERALTQLTLGKLIASLKAMPPDARVADLRNLGSYHYYYRDLYFDRGEGTRPALELLTDCEAAMGQEFTGYTGGEFLMGENTPLWVASYGRCGDKLMAVHADGTIVTAKDEDE